MSAGGSSSNAATTGTGAGAGAGAGGGVAGGDGGGGGSGALGGALAAEAAAFAELATRAREQYVGEELQQHGFSRCVCVCVCLSGLTTERSIHVQVVTWIDITVLLYLL